MRTSTAEGSARRTRPTISAVTWPGTRAAGRAVREGGDAAGYRLGRARLASSRRAAGGRSRRGRRTRPGRRTRSGVRPGERDVAFAGVEGGQHADGGDDAMLRPTGG